MEAINLELKLFLASVLWGIILLLAYDGIRVFRRIVKHVKSAEWLEDVLFWILSGCLVFRMMYKMNDGRIRIFAILGITLGMVIYHYSVSTMLVKIMSGSIKALIKAVRTVFWFIMKPFVFIGKRVKWFFQFILKMLKRQLRIPRKALKNFIKTVKISLTKK